MTTNELDPELEQRRKLAAEARAEAEQGLAEARQRREVFEAGELAEARKAVASLSKDPEFGDSLDAPVNERFEARTRLARAERERDEQLANETHIERALARQRDLDSERGLV